MNLTDEQKEELKRKIEGEERNLRKQHVIKAARASCPKPFLFEVLGVPSSWKDVVGIILAVLVGFFSIGLLKFHSVRLL